MNIAWISKIEADMPHKTSRLKMTEALVKRGNEVTLYMVKKIGGKKINLDNVICIPNIHFPILSGFFFGLLAFFYFPIHLSRKKIDFIIIDESKVWLPFLISLRILNIPLILDIRTLPVDRDTSFFFKMSIFLSQYLVDGITTITPELSTILAEVYGVKSKKIGVWSSGVSIKDFDKTDENNCLQFKSKDRKFTIIYHGDYSLTRGIENLIVAISKLDLSIKNNIRLLIIGMPTDRINVLSKLCDKMEVVKNVNILPKVEYSEIVKYLNAADAGILTLPPENRWWMVSAPLKTLEYLASGTPIIVTNIPFHQKVFEKGNCGILLESASPEDIAKGISHLYKNQNESEKMGLTGKKIAEKFYTWDGQAKKLEDFLKVILE